MVYFKDGSVVAQLAGTDMRTPISHALAWPKRLHWADKPLDLLTIGKLSFTSVDEARYPCFALARQALLAGGAAPTILNAANEVVVEAFLQDKIGFGQISTIIESVLGQSNYENIDSFESVMAVDRNTRQLTRDILSRNRKFV